MQNIFSSLYLSLSGVPAASLSGAVCSVNGQQVGCDSFAGAGAFIGGLFFVYLIVIILMIVSLWTIFKKAGQPGWACIIPIYNFIVMLQIAGRPIWWIILMFIPFVNVVVSIIVANDVAKAFGKSSLFTIGMVVLPFIFYPILAFSDAQYNIGGGAAPQPLTA